MRPRLLAVLGLLLTAASAAGLRITLVARDNQNTLISGIRFVYDGVESPPTTRDGATELTLPPGYQPGQGIKIFLAPKQGKDWFLVNPQVIIPQRGVSAELVVVRRNEFPAAAKQSARALKEPGPEDRPRVGGIYELTPEELEEAIRSFDETREPGDRGILVYRLPDAEPELRRHLDSDEKTYGPDHPLVALDLTNLALTLQATGHLDEAGPLLSRALDIDRLKFGKDHPKIAIRLGNLAQLLQDMNCLHAAEPLMRDAIAIDEKAYGTDHPNFARSLNNLAQLLQDMNRLDEAEPLMRRALVIYFRFSRRTGREHPNQRTVSRNYRYLLKAMGRSDIEIQAKLKTLGGLLD
ncbi:MAG: tetratricopeptide repeat protein [Thermoanaerobaculia bacterium]